jgi:prepilin-type processing-associated H-X9-DG protein
MARLVNVGGASWNRGARRFRAIAIRWRVHLQFYFDRIVPCGWDFARRSQCQSQLRQIGIALHSYQASHSVFPPGTVLGGWTWRAMLLPELEQSDVYGKIDFENNLAGPDAHYSCVPEWQHLNQTWPGWEHFKSLWRCPSHPLLEPIYSAYVGVSGAHGHPGQIEYFPGDSVDQSLYDGMLYVCSSVRPGQVTDGASNTLFVGEVGFSPSTYCGATGTGFGSAWLPSLSLRPGHFDDSDTSHFWSYHPGGAQFLFVDGHVRFLNYSMDKTVFFHLGSRDGGETVDF